MNNPESYFRELKKNFGVNILKFFDADPGSGMEKIRIRDGKSSDPGSGINIRVRNTDFFLVVIKRLKGSRALERFRPNCMRFDVLMYPIPENPKARLWYVLYLLVV